MITRTTGQLFKTDCSEDDDDKNGGLMDYDLGFGLILSVKQLKESISLIR